MSIFEDAGGTFFAIVVSFVAAALVAIVSFFIVIWLGGLVAPGEHNGVIGVLMALASSVTTFVLGFRKMRVTG
jgi:hypothetical protein